MKTIKTNRALALVMTTGVLAFAAVLVFTGGPVRASETDDRIDSSFKKTYVYKTYLKDEHIKISSKDGIVTLSGSVGDASHKPMAEDVGRCLARASRALTIRSPLTANSPPQTRIPGSA